MAASPILDMARTKCSQTEGTLCYSPWHQIQASTRTSQWSMASRSNNSPEFTASTSAARETYETYPKSCPRARGLSGLVPWSRRCLKGQDGEIAESKFENRLPGRPFFICGHLEDRFEKPSVSGIRPNQRQASSFPPEQTTCLWKAELFLANVIWISANLSHDCL